MGFAAGQLLRFADGDGQASETLGKYLCFAALCYQIALNSLPEGLERLKAQKRIDEAGDIYGKDVVSRALALGGGSAVAASD